MRLDCQTSSTIFLGLVVVIVAGCAGQNAEPSITGTWACTNPSSTSIEVLEFSGNGGITISQTAENPMTRAVANAVGALYGKYSIDGDILTIRITNAENQYVGIIRNGEIMSINVVSISPDSLVLSRSVLGDGSSKTYKRVP